MVSKGRLASIQIMDDRSSCKVFLRIYIQNDKLDEIEEWIKCQTTTVKQKKYFSTNRDEDDSWHYCTISHSFHWAWMSLRFSSHSLSCCCCCVYLRTNSGVISPWIDISPTQSLQSPSLPSTTAQLAVGSVSDIWLPRVACWGNVCLRNSPFWSLPNAEMNDTVPWSLCKPSAMFLPTPPPENFVSDL